METMQAIRARRSVRKYKKGAPVAREQIERLLEAAMLAPSAVNSRPWEFVVTDKEEILQKLTEVHPASRMLLTASWAIAVCGRPDLQPKHNFWQQDCAERRRKHFACGGGYGAGHLLVRLLPRRAAHGRRQRGFGRRFRSCCAHRRGRAGRSARAKRVLRPC